MAKYAIDSSTLDGIADAIRGVNGEIRLYTPIEMIDAVTDIMKSVTYLLVDEEGNEVPAVFVEAETIFTAYAEVNSESGLCIGVMTSTRSDFAGTGSDNNIYVEIPVYDLDYSSKYYINGNWYEDAEGTIPWASSLIDSI